MAHITIGHQNGSQLDTIDGYQDEKLGQVLMQFLLAAERGAAGIPAVQPRDPRVIVWLPAGAAIRFCFDATPDIELVRGAEAAARMAGEPIY